MREKYRAEEASRREARQACHLHSESSRGDGTPRRTDSTARHRSGGAMPDTTEQDEVHPRGTLALVGLLAVALVTLYLTIYFFLYVPRGAVTQ